MRKVRDRSGRSVSPTLRLSSFYSLTHGQSVLVVCTLAILPYLSSIRGDFVFDDAESVVRNPIVNGKNSITEILSRDFWGRHILSPASHKSYRPVTTFTFWLNWSLHGPSTLGFHLVNVALHSIVSILLFCFIKKLESLWKLEGLALPVAVAFAVHPVHTEAVANITGRAELLSAAFLLGALWLFVHNNCSIENRNFHCCIIFLACCLFSMLSKEQGITAPLVCLVLTVIHRGNGWKRSSSMLFGVFILMAWLRCHINGYTSPTFTEFDNAAAFVKSPILRLASFAYLWLYHLRLLVLPIGLCFDYSMGCIPPIESYLDLRIFALPVVIILPVVALFTISRLPGENKRIAQFSLLFGGITFLPASNLLVTVGFTVAERVLYIPSMGYCILLAVAYRWARKHYSNLPIISMIVIGWSLSQCYQRSLEWNNEFTLYASGLRVCPNNAKIHYNLAKVLSDHGQAMDAQKNYLEAIRLNPSYEHALNNLANLLEKEGKHGEAKELLRRAVKIRPGFPTAWMNLGITLMHLGETKESEAAFRRSLRLRPHSADCLFNLGNLYQKMRRSEEARECWQNATRLDPDHVSAWSNLLVVLDELGRCDEVVMVADQALRSGRGVAAIHAQLGSCMAQTGMFEEAEQQLLAATRAAPQAASHKANLGVLYQRWRRFDLSEAAYRDALRLDSSSDTVRENLRTVLGYTRNGTRQH